MAHFAKVIDGIVEQVIVAEQDFIDSLNDGNIWIQTSFNTKGGEHLLGGTPLRKNYANGGFTYDEERDAFIPPKPYESWTLNEETCLWNPPIQRPEEQIPYFWDEENQNWSMSPV
jgi:hypothetical protein